MNFGARSFGLTIVLLACAAPLFAQSSNKATVLNVFAVLTTPVDTKTSARGDEILMTTLNDIVLDGKLMLPKGSKLIGHVAGVVSKGKGEPKSVFAIAIDRAVRNDKDLPLEAIIIAVAAPRTENRATTSSSAHVTAARIERPGEPAFLLTETSVGAYGYRGVAISWHLTLPPPLTIFAIKAKQLRLEPGTQMLLRMIPPRAP